ncbi:MAG TPA: 4-(cytidine 5'-diphospho)-2-C-methyl-D-erythritol kinase [Stellaceae bacterium]
MAKTFFAPAKVNLYLHLVGRRGDGYHLIDSLVAFADIGDHVRVRPAPALSLELGGPEAASLADTGDDNLVLRAAHLLAAHAGIEAGAALRLEKNLPVASGIGGGSSDAAAVLHALVELWRIPIEADALARLALALGADLPICLYAAPAWVGGIGEAVEPALQLPPAGILLANPRTALPTAAVFAARRGPFGGPGRFAPMPADAAGLARVLSGRRNDLTQAAVAILPEIAVVLAELARLPGALLARMSGSGATCFALFADLAAAERGHALLASRRPGWWCAAGRLASAARQPGVAAVAEIH